MFGIRGSLGRAAGAFFPERTERLDKKLVHIAEMATFEALLNQRFGFGFRAA
jgi:hypothetical protein